MKRAVVTGGSGFLGRKLQTKLRNEGFTVESLGRSELGDITQPANWKKCLTDSRPTVIFHLIGTFHAPDDAAFDAANLHPAQALLQTMSDSKWNEIPVFLLGSAAEYGAVPNERQPILETEPARPVSAYGRSKLRVTEAAQTYGLRVTTVRLFNIFAADMSPRLMPGAVLAQLSKEGRHFLSPREKKDEAAGNAASPLMPIQTGPLDRIRDFLYADIAMQALAQIALTDCDEKIVNLCSGHGWNLRDIVSILAGDREVIENSTSSPFDVLSCIGNNDHLANLIGYRPAIPTADDFAHLIAL